MNGENKAYKALLMDDEESVRKVSGLMLSQFGVDCRETENGSDAIAAYIKALAEGEPFDVCIFDVHVPNGMGGTEAARKITETDPRASIIVASGYLDENIREKCSRSGVRGFLEKPFLLDDLVREVSKFIDIGNRLDFGHLRIV